MTTRDPQAAYLACCCARSTQTMEPASPEEASRGLPLARRAAIRSPLKHADRTRHR